MGLRRFASLLVAGFGLAAVATAATAADMPVKAAPPSPWVFDVHGFFDLTVANTRVTGGGLLLYPTNSALVQPSLGLSLDIYKSPATFINSFSIFGGVWNETYTDPHAFQALFRHWQEMDWWIGASVGFAQHWNFTYTHLEFEWPWATSAVNDVFKLGFDDSYLGWPISFNPYFQVFYNETNGTVVFGKTGNIARYEVGVVPTLSLAKSAGVPLTFTVPTWVEFGPSSFWNRNDGTTNKCGSTSTAPCALSDLGYVSTGLQAKYTLESYVPKRLGVWNVHAGVQWYHIYNQSLLAGQQAGSAAAVPETSCTGTCAVQFYPNAKKNIAVVSGGVGFNF